jgi:UPF0755 protein
MSRKPKARRSRRRLLGCALVAALLAASGVAAASWVLLELRTPYQGWVGRETTITVAPGQSAAGILDQLRAAGVLRHETLPRLYWRFALHSPALLAGEYRFAEPQTIPQVLRKLSRGEVIVHAVTLIEGLTLEETAAALAAAGLGAAERFVATMRDAQPIRDLDPTASTLEGYLFPDTYSFARGTSESAIVATLVRTFRSRLPDSLPSPNSPATLRERVVLASIVEKEAQLAEERALIAGVYAHRLRIGMALYADPTVIFALKRQGRWDGNLRRLDLQMDDPYNTYRFPGLPPGPICSPGASSLAAAWAPAPVPYLYFVSRNDGSHVFAETLAEHNRNVERWQRRYWRERWAAERAGRTPDGSHN